MVALDQAQVRIEMVFAVVDPEEHGDAGRITSHFQSRIGALHHEDEGGRRVHGSEVEDPVVDRDGCSGPFQRGCDVAPRSGGSVAEGDDNASAHETIRSRCSDLSRPKGGVVPEPGPGRGRAPMRVVRCQSGDVAGPGIRPPRGTEHGAGGARCVGGNRDITRREWIQEFGSRRPGGGGESAPQQPIAQPHRLLGSQRASGAGVPGRHPTRNRYEVDVAVEIGNGPSGGDDRDVVAGPQQGSSEWSETGVTPRVTARDHTDAHDVGCYRASSGHPRAAIRSGWSPAKAGAAPARKVAALVVQV